MEIRYHGHSCFELIDGETTLLVDPFLAEQPQGRQDRRVNPTHIALTHGHADHVADVVAVAQRTGPSASPWSRSPTGSRQGVENVSGSQPRGTVTFDGVSIKLVPAWHTNTVPARMKSPTAPSSAPRWACLPD
jgi:L-ascorbate metabolism protein UlaG (beta-lactamase superfamily)